MLLGIDGRFANMARRAGVGNFSHALLEALPRHLDGWSLRVYLDAPPRDGFPLDGTQSDLCVLPARRFWMQRVLAAELAARPPDVFLSPLLQLPWRPACPAVPVAHDLAFYRFPAEFTWRRRTQARLQARHAATCAAHWVAVSASTAHDLRALLGVPRDRISVALEAAPGRFAVPSRAAVEAVRARHALPGRFVLHVGRIQPRKNLERLIDAFGRLRARRPDLPHQLVIAGAPGWKYRGIYEAAGASPARDAIRFLGHVPDDDLPPLLGAADALALVSLWEGFGLPVLEAMACGTPVLTSSVSALPEVAGDAALLVNPNDTAAIAAGLERVLCDESLRADLALRGPARAAGFTWDRTAAAVMEAVRAAAGPVR